MRREQRLRGETGWSVQGLVPGSRWRYPGRLLALVGASLAGFAALYVGGMSLPPTDGAYGISVTGLLRDPFVVLVWTGLVAICAGLGFLLSNWLLWPVRLSRAIPLVLLATVLAATAAGFANWFLSFFAALAAGALAMVWCREQADRDLWNGRGSGSHRTAVSPGGP